MKAATCSVILVMAFGASASPPAPINYGDFDDIPPGSVMYTDVTESSFSHPHPLGPPNIAANQLDFDPPNFFATATGGRADDVATNLQFGLGAERGFSLETISIFESGRYSLGGNGTTATRIEYAMNMSVVALEVDGVPLRTPVFLPTAFIFGGDDLGQGPDRDSPWQFDLEYDVDAALSAAGVPFEFGATKLGVQIDNQVAAFSEESTFAEIRAGDFKIDTITAVIPAPGALVLLALGVGCTRGRRR